MQCTHVLSVQALLSPELRLIKALLSLMISVLTTSLCDRSSLQSFSEYTDNAQDPT